MADYRRCYIMLGSHPDLRTNLGSGRHFIGWLDGW